MSISNSFNLIGQPICGEISNEYARFIVSQRELLSDKEKVQELIFPARFCDHRMMDF